MDNKKPFSYNQSKQLMPSKKDLKMFNNCLEAEQEFETCWRNSKYTAIKVADVDVNQVL